MKKSFIVFVSLMLLCGIINAQNPYSNHYPRPEGYYDNADITAYVAFNGTYLNSGAIEVAAIVNGECRMSAFLEDWGFDHYVFINAISFNEEESTNPQQVTFMAYDHISEQEYVYSTFTCHTGEILDIDWTDDYATPITIPFFTKTDLDIVNYSGVEDAGNWYLIASPLNASVSPAAPASITIESHVQNMLSNDYDLYCFNQSNTNNGDPKEWYNYEAHTGEFILEPGKGYLYANSGDGESEQTTLSFLGAVYDESSLTVELVNDGTSRLKGWNLIGNSFTTAKTIDGRGYYRMNPVGRSELIAGTGNIDAMEGIFVYYDPEDDNEANREETVTFTNPSLKRAEGDDMVLLTLNRNNGGAIDRVIVRFDEGGTLPKYTLRDNSTIIYIPQADRDYAVVKGSATNVFPVNFKTEDFGVYTLSSDIAGANVDYMHLIDKITGEDVDMLLEGEYSFVAAPVDREDRFILRLTYTGYFDDNDVNNFAYQNGSDIVVCGDGTLQVFDVMGRFVSSQEIHGVQTIHALPMGVYIFRMVGDDVMTQKIYVR